MQSDLSQQASKVEVAMKPVLYAHPFSSYCQKALTALYENGTDFEYRKRENPCTFSLTRC